MSRHLSILLAACAVALSVAAQPATAQFNFRLPKYQPPRIPNRGNGSMNRSGNNYHGSYGSNQVRGGYRNANGSRGNASLGRNSGNLSYRDANGNGYSGYANRNRIGGGYRNSQGAGGSANVSRRNGGFNYNNGKGTKYGGNYKTDGRGNFGANGRYSTGNGYAYGGGLNRKRNGNVSLNGQYDRPGTIPGTRERWTGGVDFAGRKSQARAGLDVFDPTGKVRIAGGSANLNGRGYTQRRDVGLGNFRGQQSSGIKFGGLSSTISHGQGANLGGAVKYNYGAQVNRNGARGSTSAKIGGYRIGANASVGRNGVRAKVNVPKVNMPKMKAPKISTPKISKPKIKIKSPF